MKRWLIFVGIFLFVIGLIRYTGIPLLSPNKGMVTLTNDSSSQITGGTLKICHQNFDLGKIESGTKKIIVYKIRGDSSYDLSIRFASGRTTTKQLGYVTRGFDFTDEIRIGYDSVDLGQRSIR
jgi:hypothetical protein